MEERKPIEELAFILGKLGGKLDFVIYQKIRFIHSYSDYKRQQNYHRRLKLGSSKKITLSQRALGPIQASHSDPVIEAIAEAVDRGIVRLMKKKRRKYLGASSIGDECSRKIQYRYLNYPQMRTRFQRTDITHL